MVATIINQIKLLTEGCWIFRMKIDFFVVVVVAFFSNF